MEERRTAELMSDFDDYKITDDDLDADEDEASDGAGKSARKKKRSR